jgi:bifunctional NMN adenylyltransferase/nudix hydrolase
MENKSMKIKPSVDPSEMEIGVIVARLQVHKLHDAQRELIEKVQKNHKKVILFLGVPVVGNTERNPLDFATRKIMVQNDYPNIVVLPIQDCRSNAVWSYNLDNAISMAFGPRTALLYGGRDSFIPFYQGRFQTAELVTNVFYSGTEVRKEVSREILCSADFRAGVIHGNYGRYPTAYPTVDVACFNDEGRLLLAQKPNEDKWRFIGGHVDPSDESLERAAIREFNEETGNCEIGDLTYVSSHKVNDWRYSKLKDDIITTLFMGKFVFGSIKPSDDIIALKWFEISKFDENDYETYSNVIMSEHIPLMEQLLKKIR